MSPLRFGIIGCGGISNIHADALRRLEQDGVARLVAGGEPHPQRREQCGQRWNVPLHESLETLLQRDVLDAVTVTTLGGLHADHSMQIARSGRHVLCEKPLDTKLHKADAAIATAKQNRVTLGVISQQRFTASAQKVRHAVEAGLLGQVVLVHCETPWYRAQAYYDQAGWRGTWDMDGGVLSNQAPHAIDRMMWLGGEVEEVLSAHCKTGFLRRIEAETVAVATVRLKNGAIGTITGTTLAYEGLPQRVMICGTEGSAAFCDDDLIYFKTTRPLEEPPAAPASSGTSGLKRAADPLALSSDLHMANIRDFVLAIREGRQPLVSGEEGRKVVWLLHEIYRKAGVGPAAQPARGG